MCGIAGIWNFKNHPIPISRIKRFTDSMLHRGPDSGNYTLLNNDSLALGHRRLSILDLSEAGNQPMSYANERYTIVYNGEVYNFIELKKELIAKGFQFSTQTDTEVILAAYHNWGKDCLYRFNGMWALAIWDKEENELWLSRDRFGVKPLYYHHKEGQQFAFASETNAFKELDGFNRILNDKNLGIAIEDSFLLEGVGQTIFDGIHSILPGHWMSVKQNGSFTQHQWWKTSDHLIEVPEKYDDQILIFQEILEDACRIRLRSDVPIGTALSGGLDSSSVYGMIHHLKKKEFITERLPAKWQKAYSAVFPGTDQDEKNYASEMVDFVGGQVEWISQPSNSLADKVISSARKLDFIYKTPLFIGSDIYGAMKNDNVSVSMDGHGVDEMMYGYSFSVKRMAEESLYKNASLAEKYWKIYERMDSNKPLEPPVYKTQKLVQEKLLWKLKQEVKKRTRNQPAKTKDDLLLYKLFHETMLPSILRNFDKMAMQHGVEIRMPFMDWRLVSFVFSLPTSSKLGGGFTKRILRDSMVGIIPEKIRTRTGKTGLMAPMPDWFSGDLNTFILDIIHSTAFQNSNHWDGKKWMASVSNKKNQSDWTFGDATALWPVINAHLLIEGNKV